MFSLSAACISLHELAPPHAAFTVSWDVVDMSFLLVFTTLQQHAGANYAAVALFLWLPTDREVFFFAVFPPYILFWIISRQKSLLLLLVKSFNQWEKRHNSFWWIFVTEIQKTGARWKIHWNNQDETFNSKCEKFPGASHSQLKVDLCQTNRWSIKKNSPREFSDLRSAAPLAELIDYQT